jgi:hypothetical protein
MVKKVILEKSKQEFYLKYNKIMEIIRMEIPIIQIQILLHNNSKDNNNNNKFKIKFKMGMEPHFFPLNFYLKLLD